MQKPLEDFLDYIEKHDPPIHPVTDAIVMEILDIWLEENKYVVIPCPHPGYAKDIKQTDSGEEFFVCDVCHTELGRA